MTFWLFLSSRLLTSPLEAFFTLLIFIISKELDASPLQLTLLAAIKPTVSLVAFFISNMSFKKASSIRYYLITLNILGCLPTLFFPFIDSVWFLIAGFAFFHIAQRGSFPVWGEILKKQIGLPHLSRVFSKSTSIHYFLMIIVPFLFSSWLDNVQGSWKSIFFFLAFLQLLNSFLLIFLPSTQVDRTKESYRIKGYKLLLADISFRKYLIIFFLGGAGLVAIQPILPIFFKETLHLSYQELILAFSVCRGIAFIATSPLWASFSSYISLYRLNLYVNLCSILFFALLFAAIGQSFWLYVAYFFYGIMQAGCDISWNISGPTFSKQKDSIPYSSLNLLLVGIRGCICPFLGEFLFLASNAIIVILFAGIVTFFGILYALKCDQQFKFRLNHL